MVRIDFTSYPYQSRRMPVFARNVVAASQPLAASAGIEAMRRGGNAMDAALATAIALTVVEPTSNGIGSDAFALVWAQGTLHGFNGSGRSPLGWNIRKFEGLDRVPTRGWEAVTVPGAVDTWAQCSRRFGRMPFSELFDAAIRYAEDGFIVSPVTAGVWNRAAPAFTEFDAWNDTFLFGGRAPSVGEAVRLPDHAETLRTIAESEGDAFYRGPIAERIAQDAKKHGADMVAEDLARHVGEWVDPISTEYQGHALHEIPPNGQGLAALIALGILQHLPLSDTAVDSADFHHLQIEAMKVAFAEVFAHLSDPATMRVSVDDLLDDGYLAGHARRIDLRKASRPSSMLASAPSTVYLCAADDEGTMVSFIQSNFNGFGSGVVVPGTGIALQNRGAGFVLESGHPNEAAPGKRPYHTIIPGFVTCGGAPVMGFGVMGGHMQAQGHVQTMVRVFGFGQNPQAASDAPRWQVAENGEIFLEVGFPARIADELSRRGHTVLAEQPSGLFGGGQYALKLDDGYCAASDPRKDGCALGY